MKEIEIVNELPHHWYPMCREILWWCKGDIISHKFLHSFLNQTNTLVFICFSVESLFDVFTSLHSFDMFHYFQKKSNAMLNNVHFYWPPCGITQHVSFRFINSVIGGEKSSQNTIFESLLAPAEQHAAFLSIRRIAGISAVCGVVTMVRFIYNLHTITTTWDLL